MNLNVEKILIIGLGMIGGSIAMASKSKGIKVVGFDAEIDYLNIAVQKEMPSAFQVVAFLLSFNTKAIFAYPKDTQYREPCLTCDGVSLCTQPLH